MPTPVSPVGPSTGVGLCPSGLRRLGAESRPRHAAGGMEPDWAVTLDINLFRQYAAAVYEATDESLASVSDAELDRIVDPGFAPPMPVRSLVANLLAWHAATHQGNISALKG